MLPALKKAVPVRLRSIGFDERWLQDRIDEEPSILGLGDLSVLRREKSQPSGGRLDFLLYDPDGEVRYEVEMMLGTLDESHIIRTIEYWDIERQRYPAYDHRAVIVAEEITARFFNVIRLLNRSVPMVALQLNAFMVDGGIVLHFTKVLDVLQEADEGDDGGGDQADRHYWEERAGAVSLSVMDSVIGLVSKEFGHARATYNRNHIALGTTGYNFCWFHPRQSTPHCHLRLKTGSEDRSAILDALEVGGISATPFQTDRITIKLSPKHLEEGRDAVLTALRHCEERARAGNDEG